METNLQSSEVRIPKTPQSPAVCQQFKSTFARSLSFNTTNQQPIKPLDFELNFRIATDMENLQNISGSSTATTVQKSHKVDEIDEDFEEFMRNSPLKQSLQNLTAKSTVTPSTATAAAASTTTTPTTPTRKNVAASRAFNTTCSGRHRFQDTQGNKSCSPEIELLRLRKECQSLLEENRRLVNRNGSNEIIHGQDSLIPTTNNSVEEAVLQTQIETLQWQLTQVESSRQMYHALMEEVVRFLERCYQSIESIQKNNKIARSRSINHMFIEQSAQPSTKNERRISDIGSLRSNLNIAADKTGVNYAQSEKDQLNESFASSITTTSNSTDSYNNFTDFTWRRSPKKSPQKGLNDDDAEKLSQEAFRLYRTAQNLLNLKEPILSESKTLQSFHRNSLTDLKSTGLQTYAGPTTLQRKLKTRESHNSYQSNSTSDGSVHSNSSSIRTETDEENHLDGRANGLPVLNGNSNRRLNAINSDKYNPTNDMEAMTLGKDRIKSVASSADDESGFSSMSSFHHEPNILPPLALNSTMLSNQLCMEDDVGDNGTGTGTNLNKMENHHYLPKPETIDGTAFHLIHSECKSLPPVIHKRYDSAPPIPPKKKLTTFTSLKNENSPDKATGIHVLWV